jgi:c-di-GMP-binding flagellar brake protein YcgR
MDSLGRDRRLFTRFRIKTKVSLSIKSIGSKERYDFQTSNLSSGGMFVYTEGNYHPFQVQSIVEVWLAIREGSEELTYFMGKVAHVQQNGFGVKISDIDPKDQHKLNEYIALHRDAEMKDDED